MASPLRNPFYVPVLLACAALLGTMLVYLLGWLYVPNPDRPNRELAPMPPWMKWIDANAIYLIGIEVAAILVLTVLMIGLDRYFDPKEPGPLQ